jgi:hypothetical protein
MLACAKGSGVLTLPASPRWQRPHGSGCLARDLADVVAETVLDATGLVKPLGHQGFDSLLGGGSPQ